MSTVLEAEVGWEYVGRNERRRGNGDSRVKRGTNSVFSVSSSNIHR